MEVEPPCTSNATGSLVFVKERLCALASALQPSICRRPAPGEMAALEALGIRVPDWDSLRQPVALPPPAWPANLQPHDLQPPFQPPPQRNQYPAAPSGRQQSNKSGGRQAQQHQQYQQQARHDYASLPPPVLLHPLQQQGSGGSGGAAAVPKLSRAVKTKSNGAGRTYTSKFRGVHQTFPTKRWEAQFRRNGKPTSLGCFDSEEEAARAYDKMMLWAELHKQAGVKAGITNYETSDYEADIPYLKAIKQDDLINELRSVGRRQAAQRMLKQKQGSERASGRGRGRAAAAKSREMDTESSMDD